jgi:hypothetical protein
LSRAEVFAKKCIDQQLRGKQWTSIASGRRHLLKNVTLEDCTLDSVLLATPGFPFGSKPHEFRDVSATRCSFKNCLIKHAVLQNVQCLDCKASAGGLVLWRCFLNEVTLDGVYETLTVIPPKGGVVPEGSSFMIDIRAAKCGEIEIMGIPPERVKYDPSFAGVLSRTALESAGWPTSGVSDYFGGAVIKFRTYGGDKSVYVVPTAAPDAADLLRELEMLKERGWVQ